MSFKENKITNKISSNSKNSRTSLSNRKFIYIKNYIKFIEKINKNIFYFLDNLR